MEIRGIDVSSLQGKIDWSQVASAGYQLAIIRSVKRGGVIDSYFEANYKGAIAQGLKTGVYIFSYALTLEEAVNEAASVVGLLDGRPIDMPIWLDLEWSKQRELGKEMVTDIALTFLKTITNNTTYQAGIYCNLDWYYNVIQPQRLPCDFWIASYGDNNGSEGVKPDVPGLAGWQYTSNGTVPGIEGPVDLDVFYKNYSEIQKAGWITDSIGRWYRHADGSYTKNAWEEIDGKWYWFNESGYAYRSQWLKYKDKWYYLGADYAMAVGLQIINEKVYYFQSDGAMAEQGQTVTLEPGPSGALE